MKYLSGIFFVVFASLGFSQDTIEFIKFNDGTKSFKLTTKKDTSLIYIYPNGKKESSRPMRKNQITGKYSRWYESGKLMWEKELVNGIQEGSAIFFDEKGKKVAELTYEKGIIVDTVFIQEDLHLILGKITYHSKVYGGMQREDGSSNISEYSGPFMNCSMYAAKIDSLKKPEFIQNFKSDYNGDFFILAPEGRIGYFPKSIDIKSLASGEYHIPKRRWSSGNEGWDLQGPTEVGKESDLLFILLNYSSVGYAP